MNIYQKLSPAYLPPHLSDKNGLPALRERILQAVLLAAAGFGLPLTVLASYNGIRNGEYYLAWIYIPLFLIVAGVTIARGLPYALRGQVVTYLIFLLALSELVESGQIGEVRMILLAFVALTAAFFNYRGIIFSILLSLAVIIGASVYVSLVPNPALPALAHIREGTLWSVSSLTFVMLAVVIAGAIAMMIDGLNTILKKQAALSESLVSERNSLEARVGERTRGMERRIVQLRTAAEISRAMSGLNDAGMLMQQVADLIKERYTLYYVGVFLLDPTRQYAVLRAGTGAAGQKMRDAGHRLAVNGQSMIGWCIANGRPRIAQEAGADGVRFNNPDLPLTHSELALPIMAYGHILGAMTVQSETPEAFDENDITLLEGITDSLAVALENDRLFRETRRSLDEIRSLNHDYLQKGWAETLETGGRLAYTYANPGAANATTANGATFTLQTPLALRETLIGEITLEMDRPALSAEENAMLEYLSAQTALALENARLLYDNENRAFQEQKLAELTGRFSQAMSIEQLLRAAAQAFGQLPAAADVSVQLAIPGSAAVKSETSGNGNGKEHSR